MPHEMRDIVVAALCELTIGVDGDGQLIQHIADKRCQFNCGHCQLTADYIIAKLKEGARDDK